jgi:hypothetical protein
VENLDLLAYSIPVLSAGTAVVMKGVVIELIAQQADMSFRNLMTLSGLNI